MIQTLRGLYSTTPSDNEVASILYDFPGKVMKTLTKQVFLGNTNTVTETSTYDHAGRLKQVKHQVNSGTEVTLASMEYDEVGQLKQKSLNGEVDNGIQNLNYSYNIRGWLEKINNPDDTNPSLTSTRKLNLGLYYNNVPSGLSASSQYNGNISGLVWNTPEQSGALSPADKQGYGFTYDGLNRLRTSNYSEGSTFATNAGANNENVDYDKNGNITLLTRYRKGTGLIDNLTYTYKSGGVSNMLDRVDDAAPGAEGFSENVKQAGEYSYDSNGNLIADLNKGYNSVQYNYLNLPKRIGTTGQFISYVYDAAGTKLAKINTGGAYTYYAGSFVYSGSSLNYIINREGMYLPGGNYQYYLKDHLGNTRLVVNTSGVGGTIVQQTDYYPFGMDIATYNGGLDNKYRYNGKELQNDLINNKNLDWYDYGARFYDPTIGRWHSVDPLAESYRRWSPYNYCMNNPMRFIDPDGMGVGDYYGSDSKHEHLGSDGEVDDKVYTADAVSKDDKGNVISAENAKEVKGLISSELNTRAFMATTTEFEGGGYNIKYGGGTFEGNDHPVKELDKNGVPHSAAGAYQITEGTAKGLMKNDKTITDFSPVNQDKMAVSIMKSSQNSLKDVKMGNLSSAVAKLTGKTGLAVQWEALPGGGTKSKSMTQFNNSFKVNISNELNNKSKIVTPQGQLKIN